MPSKVPRPANLRDKLRFPTFKRLPDENDVSLPYYTESGIGFAPAMHWCLLVEIVGVIPWPVRPMFHCKDLDGQELLVAFHLANTDKATARELTKDGKIGCTMTINHAEQHQFMDGQVGIRVEDASCVKFFQCDLASFMKIGDDLENPSNLCPVCSKPAALPCPHCPLKYCSQKCKVGDWKSEHKKMCSAGQQIIEWGEGTSDGIQALTQSVPNITCTPKPLSILSTTVLLIAFFVFVTKFWKPSSWGESSPEG